MARWFALGAIVGPILFTCSWLILGLIPTYYTPLLTVPGMIAPISWLGLGPTGRFMNTAFVLCGLLLLCGILGVFYSIEQMGAFKRWTCTSLLGLSPLGLIICGLVPVTSTFPHRSAGEIVLPFLVPSLSPVDQALHDTYFVTGGLYLPFWNPLHCLGFLLIVASPVFAFLVTGIMLWFIPSWRHFGGWLVLGAALTFALVVLFLALSQVYLAGTDSSLLGLAGVTNRALFLEVQTWFVASGWLAFRPAAPPRPGGRLATVFAVVGGIIATILFPVAKTRVTVGFFVLLILGISTYAILRFARRVAWRVGAFVALGFVILLVGWHLWRRSQLALAANHPSQVVRLKLDFRGVDGFTRDAGRLKTGRFLYQDFLNGKPVGSGEILIRRAAESGNFIFTNLVTGQFVPQQWKAVATASFVPISVELSFGQGLKMEPAFKLSYQVGRVRGFALTKARAQRQIDLEVPPDTVDQRIDWAAAMSEALTPSREFDFHVFDPGAGISGVTGFIAGVETATVPAGTFEVVRIVYRINKPSGGETYQLLVNRQGPRILVKEEFPNGLVSVLVKAEGDID
jgi:hypothetical protein